MINYTPSEEWNLHFLSINSSATGWYLQADVALIYQTNKDFQSGENDSVSDRRFTALMC